MPWFGKAGIRSVVNGPDGYTPDGLCLISRYPGLRNLLVLAGGCGLAMACDMVIAGLSDEAARVRLATVSRVLR